MLSSESTIRKLTYQNKQLKTEQLLNQTFSPEKYLKQQPSKSQYYVVCQLRNLMMAYVFAMLSYTQKRWAMGFRPLIKDMNFYQSGQCVEMPSIIVPWHIHVKIHKALSIEFLCHVWF